MTKYIDAGVDRLKGDSASAILYAAAKKTWQVRDGKLGEVISPTNDFSGVRAINVSNLPKGTLMNFGFDGVGTKIEIAERMNNHRTIAFDLFAMVCDDAIVRKAEPVVIGSIIDMNSVSLPLIKQLTEGYVAAAKEANVAVVNGELAEIGNRVSGYGIHNYNWGAAVIWFANEEKLITGKEIQSGEYIISLKEDGFRSNGISLVRRILSNVHGDEWHTQIFNGNSLGSSVLVPSRIYAKAIVDMFGGYAGQEKVPLHGIVHVTGGGIPEKLRRVLKPSGLGAVLTNIHTPPPIMIYCQDKGQVSDTEAYQTWNMGNGMLLITPEPDLVLEYARVHSLEAKVCGRIDSTQSIIIESKGLNNEKITFPL